MNSDSARKDHDPAVDRAWERLVAAVEHARHEEAERLLHEVEGESAELSEDEVRGVVARVLGGPGRAEPGRRPRGARGRRSRLWRPVVAVPILALVAAGTLTTIVIRYSTWTLAYADAVDYFLDRRLDYETRYAALGRVFRCVEYGMRELKKAGETSDDAAAAFARTRRILRDRRAPAPLPPVMREPPFLERVGALGTVLELEALRALIRSLEVDAVVGLDSLLRVAREESGTPLSERAASFFGKLATMFPG